MKTRWWDPGIAKGDRSVRGCGNSRILTGCNRRFSLNLYGPFRVDWSRERDSNRRLDMTAFKGDRILPLSFIRMGSCGYQGSFGGIHGGIKEW